MIRRILNKLGAFRREEDGNGTIEFVMMLPIAIFFFASSYEGGILSTRQVMLERGMDVAVREVRIGVIRNPTHENLTRRICEVAVLIPDCINQLRLEMVSANPRNFVAPPPGFSCVDRNEQSGTPVINFNPGLNNQLMILRACALFDPMLPTVGLGKVIPKQSAGAYALVSTSSYVMEPFQ